MGYDISDTVLTRTRIHNLCRHKHMQIPLDHSDGYSIIEGKFLIKGNYSLSAGLELGRLTFSHLNGVPRPLLNQLRYEA